MSLPMTARSVFIRSNLIRLKDYYDSFKLNRWLALFTFCWQLNQICLPSNSSILLRNLTLLSAVQSNKNFGWNYTLTDLKTFIRWLSINWIFQNVALLLELSSTMPGMKIRDDDRKEIDPRFKCVSCHLIVVDPMQSKCGHMFCKACMVDLLM